MTNQLQAIARLATEALEKEVALTPKPGLVDSANSGAHTDMDQSTFKKSIVALQPFFLDYLEMGFGHQGTPKELFQKLREHGQLAEEEMLKATEGINTHKGANFSFALFLGATGLMLQQSISEPSLFMEKLFSKIKQISEGLISQDLQNLDKQGPLSYGEKLYLEYGITGIRGEAEQGYPTVQKSLLPFIHKHQTYEEEEVFLRALILLMSQVEDGNIIHRGGYLAWKVMQTYAQGLHEKNLPTADFYLELERYDQIMIKQNLSPGGSADLLAIGIYLVTLQKNLNNDSKTEN